MQELWFLWTHTTGLMTLGFFVLPGLLALLAVFWMCRKAVKLYCRLYPVMLALLLGLLVWISAKTGLFAAVIGGFAGALVLGSCVCLVLGSLLGFLAALLAGKWK